MPLITGTWTRFPASALAEERPGPPPGPLHFFGEDEYIDPLTGQGTGHTAREEIEAQAALYGWPLVGIYISGAHGSAHVAIPEASFPVIDQPNAQLRLSGLISFVSNKLAAVRGDFHFCVHFTVYHDAGSYQPEEFGCLLSTWKQRAGWWDWAPH